MKANAAALCVAALVAIGSPSSAAAEAEAFTFMGRTIGDPLSKWEKTLDLKNSILNCAAPDRFGQKRCRDRSLKKHDLYSRSYVIGELPVNHLIWRYLDDRLIGFYLAVQWGDAGTLYAMAVGKWGPSATPFNEGALWRLPDGELWIYREEHRAILEFTSAAAQSTLDQRAAEFRRSLERAGKQHF